MLKGVPTACENIQNAGYCYSPGRDGFRFKTECGNECWCEGGEVQCDDQMSCYIKAEDLQKVCDKVFENNNLKLSFFLED